MGFRVWGFRVQGVGWFREFRVGLSGSEISLNPGRGFRFGAPGLGQGQQAPKPETRKS